MRVTLCVSLSLGNFKEYGGQSFMCWIKDVHALLTDPIDNSGPLVELMHQRTGQKLLLYSIALMSHPNSDGAHEGRDFRVALCQF
jgi:hypothetical protein